MSTEGEYITEPVAEAVEPVTAEAGEEAVTENVSAPISASENSHDVESPNVEQSSGEADNGGDTAEHSTYKGPEGTSPQERLKFFVGGLHPTVDEGMLTEHFMKYGRVITAQVMRDYNSGRSRGFGFVTLYVQENTENLFSDEHNVNGKHVDVRRMQNDAASNMKRKIFVGGLPKSLSEQMLKTFFERFGAVEKVTIMRQYDGSSRGFGFVIFAVDGAVEKVLESPSHFVYGSKVDVRAAESRSKQAAARLENQYKNMMRHGYNADYGTDRTMALQSPYGNAPKVAPTSMPSPVVPYDAQYYQQQLLYQQYALQSQYAYYAQQSGSGSGTTDPSRYVTQRPNTFGQQPNSQNNIARMYRSKPY